jgi:uncharacterized protein YggE
MTLFTFPGRRVVLLVLVGCLLFPAWTFADDAPVRKITVVGSATITVVPDEMHWTVQVSIDDATLATAKARHDTSLLAALDYLKGLGADQKDLQTGGIRIQKNNFAPATSEAASKPFNCSTQFTFTLVDFDKYGPLCDALAKLDGVQVQSVDYASSRAEKTKREALKQALLDAHDKANDLAVTAEGTLGKPLDIQEGTSGEGPRPVMMFGGMAKMAGGTPNAVPGQIEITAMVTATYQLN